MQRLPENPHKIAFHKADRLARLDRNATVKFRWLREDLQEQLVLSEGDSDHRYYLLTEERKKVAAKELELRKHVDTINRFADAYTDRQHTIVALSNELLDVKETVAHHKWTANHQRAHAEDLWKRLQKAEANTSHQLVVAAPFMGVAILLLLAFVVMGFARTRELQMQLDEVAPTLVCEAH